MALQSGHFSESLPEWTILEKEALAIMASTESMHWLLATPLGLDLCTNQNNLVLSFGPLAATPDLSQTSTRKALLAGISLSAYKFFCIHIKGWMKVFSDLLVQWSTSAVLHQLIHVPILSPSSFDSFVWPSFSKLKTALANFANFLSSNSETSNGLWKDSSETVWISDNISNV